MIMVSFCSIMESMAKSRRGEDRSVSAIETGLGIDEEFWDKFLRLLNNSDSVSELLDVPTTTISKWHDRIKSAIEKRDSEKLAKPSGKNKKLI